MTVLIAILVATVATMRELINVKMQNGVLVIVSELEKTTSLLCRDYPKLEQIIENS